jgi:hypothetical protein
MVKVKTVDGGEFDLSKEQIAIVPYVEGIVEQFGEADVSVEVTTAMFNKVMQFIALRESDPLPVLEKPLTKPLSEIVGTVWMEFLGSDRSGWINLGKTASSLEMESLKDLVGALIASICMFEEKEGPKIRARFGVEEDLTAEDIAKVETQAIWTTLPPRPPAAEWDDEADGDD